MYSIVYKVYGYDGHRNAVSFDDSFWWDFSNDIDGVRILECFCCDRTGTNDYVILKITRNTETEVVNELHGQVSDGLFENYRIGDILEISKYSC